MNQKYFSQKDLNQIAATASIMKERLRGVFVADDSLENDTVVDSRIEQWCEIAAQGDWTKFEKRLAWEGLDLQSVRDILGSVKINNNQQLPSWTKTLNECMGAIEEVDLNVLARKTSEKNRFLDVQNPLPFEEVLLSFIYVARKKLIAKAGSDYKLLTDESHASLERSLLGWLSHLCSLPMELEFSGFRAGRQTTFVRLFKKTNNDSSNKHYQDFIKGLIEGGLLSFFQEYPVLARLMAIVTDLWIDANQEFLLRLSSDWSEIQKIFQTKTELEQVVAVQPCLSDRHHNGRSVTAITFASGLKLIYKPKNIDIEKAYFDLLAWLNQQKFPLPFKLLKIINRPNYGWVEFVETRKCQEQAEAKRYYQRAGALLCLVYLLDATDLHIENIIACSEHPVLIDMETLMHPWVRELDDSQNVKNAQYLANQKLLHSVIRSGFLPRWEIGRANRSYDATGLGGISEQETSFQIKQWNNINTDTMSLSLGYEKIQPSNNVPSLNDINMSLKDYDEEIVDGFQQMYRFLIKHRKSLLAADSPLQNLSHQQVRFVFRATKVYSSILQKTLHPKFLRDGAERSIQLDILSRVMLLSDSKPFFMPLLDVEKEALEQIDVPLFTAHSDSDALPIAPNQTIDQYFTEPSFNLVISRLNDLNEKDLEQQIGFIQGSLYAHAAIDGHFSLLSDRVDRNVATPDVLTQEQAVRQATAIAITLQKQAIFSDDSSATWIAPQYVVDAQKLQLQPIGYDLYSGSCGIALFLAALEKVTGSAEFHDLTLAALQPLRSNLQNSTFERTVEQFGIGGATGCGSAIYGLVRCGQFLEDSTLLEDAQQVASFITSELITADRKFDVISGTAGTILGLLALYEVSNNPKVLEQASICGRHLLNNRVSSSSGKKSWITLDGKIITGFSHGIAGIAYALLRLHRVTGETAFLEAASEAISYENSLFIPELGNWSTSEILPTDKNLRNWCSWCYGASGIGLARVGGLYILDTDEIRQNIEVAINTTKQYKNTHMDHLCCGTLGRVELLFTAAGKLSQPQLLETALKQAAHVVVNAQQRGSFSYGSAINFQPGLFQGAGGIGYELLRLTHPNQLPSVLLWE